MGTEADIQVLNSKIQSVEDRLDKHDESQKRMWERIDQQAKDMVRIQVVMENLEKSMSEIKIGLAAIEKSMNAAKMDSHSRWEQYFEKFFWLVLGVVGYFVYGYINK